MQADLNILGTYSLLPPMKIRILCHCTLICETALYSIADSCNKIWMGSVETCHIFVCVHLHVCICEFVLSVCTCNAAALCSTLQHTATHGNTMQHAATHCKNAASRCTTLHHTTTRCNTRQHTVTHSNTLQHTCNTLQRTAMPCNRRRQWLGQDTSS